MVLIGYNKNLPKQEIYDFLKSHGIVYIGEDYTEEVLRQAHKNDLDDMVYIEVETQELHKNGLCSLGCQQEINNKIRFLLQNIFEEKSSKSVLKRLFDDADAWCSLVQDFASRYGAIALRRHYDECPNRQNNTVYKCVNCTSDHNLNPVGFHDLFTVHKHCNDKPSQQDSTEHRRKQTINRDLSHVSSNDLLVLDVNQTIVVICSSIYN